LSYAPAAGKLAVRISYYIIRDPCDSEERGYRRTIFFGRMPRLQTVVSPNLEPSPWSWCFDDRSTFYAEIACRPSSASVAPEDVGGFRLGMLSIVAIARRSTLPITGCSFVPATDREINRLSVNRRSIKRRSFVRRTSCGSEEKLRNVQSNRTRSRKFGCK